MAKVDSLRAVVDFAIEREQEAVDFYSRLAGAAQIKPVADELRRIASMEEVHRDRLKALSVSAVAATMPEAANELNIANYRVDAKPGPSIIWQQVVEIAIQREQASLVLYTALGKLTSDPPTKQLFGVLSAEEAGHRAYFQQLFDLHLFAPAEGPG
jgi:rubrerythrin